ncbi:hypothetical protein Tco_0744856 [Tanacetum coccineum]
MDSDLNIQDDQWELSLDINDSDLRLTPVLRPSGSTRNVHILLGWDGVVMSTQDYMKKVVEDVGEDEDFKSGSWVSATDYVNANGGIVSGCIRRPSRTMSQQWGNLTKLLAINQVCVLARKMIDDNSTVTMTMNLSNCSNT